MHWETEIFGRDLREGQEESKQRECELWDKNKKQAISW